MSPPTRLQDIQRKVVDVGVLGLLTGILISVGALSVIGGMKLAVRSSEVEVPNTLCVTRTVRAMRSLR